MEATKYWARPITHRCTKITRSWQIHLHSLSPATFSDFDSWFWTRVSLNLIAHCYLLFLQIVKALFKPKHTLFCIFWLPHQAARGSTAQPHSAGKHHQIIATYFSTAGIDAGVWKCSQKITSRLLCSSYRKGALHILICVWPLSRAMGIMIFLLILPSQGVGLSYSLKNSERGTWYHSINTTG